MSALSEPPSPQAAVAASPVLPVSLSNFSYTAQTEHGFRLKGSIEAPDHLAAVQVLEGMRLRVVEVIADKSPQPTPIRDDAFILFNRRLMQLAKSGLPVEDGLRLIAADMRRGRMAEAIAKISTELRNGVPLTEAFDKHGRRFPRLYGRLLDAGIRGGNLPGVLLNLGRHLELQQRLRGALWRSVSYPMATFVGLLLVTSVIGFAVMPQIKALFGGFQLASAPVMIDAVIWFGAMAPWLAAGIGIAMATFAIAQMFLRAFGAETMATERFLLPIPLIGPVLRFNLIARWLDAVRIGVIAGLDLPAAIELAGDTTRSPALRGDGQRLATVLASGMSPLDVTGRLLPATIATTLEFAARHHADSDAIQTLCDLYERQAELRLERIPAILTPILIILITIVVGFVICGIVMPLVMLIKLLLGIV